VQELHARALAERGYALSPDELVTTLGATTTLPGDVIARLAPRTARTAWRGELNVPALMISAAPRLLPSPAASRTAITSPQLRRSG
jgi:hypothetical protein